jgi:DNA-binding transcriptional ArsR family regulator
MQLSHFFNLSKHFSIIVMTAKKINSESYKLTDGSETISLHYSELRQVLLLLRALEHDIRKSIIEMLHESNKLTVTDIYIKLRIEQSVASQHLAILRKSNIVLDNRQGKNIYYTLNKERLSEVATLIAQLA